MAKRILAIASGGGHWQQLQQMRPAFEMHDVFYMATLEGLPQQFNAHPAAVIPDCNRHEPLGMLRVTARIAAHLLRRRPDVVITTGAMPGLIGLVLGRMLGAQTIWVDSVANCEKLSMSGNMARRVAHLCLTQWQHVAEETNTEYAGSIL